MSSKSEVEIVDSVPSALQVESLFEDAEVVEEDMGEPVVWDNEPQFAGYFTGLHKTISLPDLNNPEQLRDSNLYGFTQIPTGTKRSIWGNYQIDGAMENVSAGDAVLFRFEGKRQNGTKQVNTFTIKVKRAS